MQRRRSYQWLSELVESDTERVVGFQRMFGVQWVTPPNANSMPGAAGAAGSIAGDNSAANSSGLITTASVANSSLGSSSDGINVECVQYVRGHFLIYCLFRFGAFLGEELFYTLFLPNFGWSVNWRLGRQLILMWAVMYYSGQLLKDVMQLPRPPCPPVVHLEKHFADEYGFPSTHAMAAISVPFFIAIKLTPPMSVLVDSVRQVMGPDSGLLSILESPLQTPPLIWSIILLWTVAFMWWITMTCSRLFLGVHSFVDVFAGMVLGLLAMSFCLIFADYIDRWVALSSFGGVGFVIIGIVLVIFFWYAAKPTKWTPCYGDTTLIVGVGVGSLVGSRYVIGPLWDHEILPWTVLPSFFASDITSEMIQRKVLHFFLRSFVGYALMATVRVVVKQCMLALMHMLLPLWKSADPIASMEAGMAGSGSGAGGNKGELIEPPTPELRYDGQSSSDVGRYATEIPTKFVTYFAVSYCAAAALHPLFEYYDWYS